MAYVSMIQCKLLPVSEYLLPIRLLIVRVICSFFCQAKKLKKDLLMIKLFIRNLL